MRHAVHIMLVAKEGFDSKDTYCGEITLHSAKPTCIVEDCDCMDNVTCDECILLYFAEQEKRQNDKNYEPMCGKPVKRI